MSINSINDKETICPFELLEQRANQPKPDFWQKETEPTIIGKMVEKGSFMHDRYGLQSTITLQTKDNRNISIITNDYVRSGLEMQNACEGDFIRIDYLGTEKSSRGSHYNRFKIDVVKAGSSLGNLLK